MSLATPGTPEAVHPDYAEFITLFNAGRFWDSHEALEGLWRHTGSDFFQGLILYASAFVHVDRGNRHGIAAQFAKAAARLGPCSPAYLGLDVHAILRHADECRHLVVENRDAPPPAWSVLIPRPTLQFDPALVRGSEPELAGS